MDVWASLVPTSSRIQTSQTIRPVIPEARIEIQPTFRHDQGAECIEEPPMAIQFLLLLFFKTKDHMSLDFHGRFSNLDRCGALEDVCGDSFAMHCAFNAVAIVALYLCGTSALILWYRYLRTYTFKGFEGVLMDITPTIKNDTKDSFLPTVTAPRLGLVETAEMSNVPENSEARYQDIVRTHRRDLATYELNVRPNRISSSSHMVIKMKSSVPPL